MQTTNHASHYKYGVVGKLVAWRVFDVKLSNSLRCRPVIQEIIDRV